MSPAYGIIHNVRRAKSPPANRLKEVIIMTHTERINNYKATSAAHAYIIGFIVKTLVYCLTLTELPDWMFKDDREGTSHGGALKLRFNPTKNDKYVMIHTMGAEVVGTVDEVLTGRKNKGEAWEKYLTEKAGQTWKKDSVPYYLDGDLTVDGIKYQIKFESASFANENTIQKALEYKAAH